MAAAADLIPIRRTRSAPLLVVDDNPVDAELLLQVLDDEHFDQPVRVIERGAEALAYLRGEGKFVDREAYPAPRIVVLDLGLPDLSGFQILEELRRDRDLSGVPVIVYTGSLNAADAERAYSLGATNFLVKSTDLSAAVGLARSLRAHAEGVAVRDAYEAFFSVDTAPVGFLTLDREGRVQRFNPAVADVLGVRPGAGGIGSFFDFMDEEAAARVREQWTRLREGQSPLRCEIEVLPAAGSPAWVQVRSSLHRGGDSENGQPLVFCTLTDVTERVYADRAAARNASFARSLMSEMPVGLALCDAEGRVRESNPAFENMFRVETGELQMCSLFDLVHPDDEERLWAAFQNPSGARGTERRRIDVRYVRWDGAVRTVRQSISRVDPDDPSRLLVVAEDRTLQRRQGEERAQLQAALVRARSEADAGSALERFAEHIAGAFAGHVEALHRSAASLRVAGVPDRGALESLDALVAEAQATLHSVRRRPGDAPAPSTDLRSLLLEVMQESAGRDRTRPPFRIVGSDRPRLSCDVTVLQECLSDFIECLARANPDEDAVLVELSQVQSDGSALVGGRSLPAATYARLMASLRLGPEAPARTLEGLGLASSHAIAIGVGGAAELRVGDHDVATLEIWLPLDRDPALAALSGALCDTQVLLIEPRPGVAAAYGQALAAADARVVPCISAEDAIDALRARLDADAIVVAELLPGASGVEFLEWFGGSEASRIEGEGPRAVVLIGARDASGPSTPGAGPATQLAWIEGPVSGSTLVGALVRALSASPRR